MSTPRPPSAARVRAEPLALTEVFPWMRHLDAEEVRAFTVELLEALSDAAGPDAGEAVHRAVISWRATARISAEDTG